MLCYIIVYLTQKQLYTKNEWYIPCNNGKGIQQKYMLYKIHAISHIN